MKKILLTFIVLTLFSCKQDNFKEYKQKNHIDLSRFAQVDILVNLDYYEMKVGDTLPIYYRTNTCCPFCIPKMKEIPQLKYLGNKLIYDCPFGTEGANITASQNFLAVSKGIVTLEYGIVTPNDVCDSLDKPLNKIIIHIK